MHKLEDKGQCVRINEWKINMKNTKYLNISKRIRNK